MAYAEVASLTETIDLILNYHHHSISPQLKNGIASVHENAIFFRSFLEDFPDETKNWEERMREVTNKAEDIIELLLSDSWLEWSVGSSTSMLRNDLDELERVAEEMESIAKGVKERHSEAVVDLDDGLFEIIDRLTGGSSWLQIIPIVGMGGIGKTTLARNAYNHPFIVEHFDIRAWATVSQNFTTRGLLSSLLNTLGQGQRNTSCSEDEQMSLVHKTLWGRRYLIVIDNIWSVEVWDNLHFLMYTMEAE